jgi:2-desacetyl-2-hydroxyethyl bacteriochlorophyllide A dehydrogenase
MKAAVLHKFNSPLSLDTVPLPEIGNTDVLVKIKASGICHSDLHHWRGSSAFSVPPKLPLILGHECAGVVERVGPFVKNVKPGDRVVADYLLTCGDCYYCSSGRSNLCDSARAFGYSIDGAYAEYMALPSRQLFSLPAEISYEQGAIIGCAVVTAYHAVRFAELTSSNSVAIFGIGGIGYNILKLSQALGAKRIIAVDVDDRKLARASRLGAETINPNHKPAQEMIEELTGGNGVDLAFEAIGLRQTAESAIRAVGRGGKAVLVGLCFEKIEISPVADIMLKEIQIESPSDHLRAEIPEVIELVRQHRIDLSDSITHRLSLDEANRGLEILEKKIDDPMRVVMLQ